MTVDRQALSALLGRPLDLEAEILSEKASALGRAGQKVERALAALREAAPDAEERPALLRAAAHAVHHYFIQREICGFRRHGDIIREYAIPPEVLARLGAQ
ncbi:DUF6665 family protein [Consotaella salsifontis]|uniref:Uncharacterized protein n=1 Tax=Consotaella salsifontis TaxID=1365950 RepID=A0A1T4NZ88_9HYPH|nr:DUF6665 family protein [Consotaella salsifontis]SJZ84710.1 hypothetical protein SAMN05428963_103262 [Consotaella salsifontis]